MIFEAAMLALTGDVDAGALFRIDAGRIKKRQIKPEKSSRSESGTAQFLEMTLIFPLVLALLAALLVGSYSFFENASIERIAQKYAMLAVAECECPGYTALLNIDSNTGRFISVIDAPGVGEVNTVSSEHHPYRYLAGETPELFPVLERALLYELNKNTLSAGGSYSCEIKLDDSSLRMSVTVIVKKEGKSYFNGRIKTGGTEVSATAAVLDPSDFVRNTELVCKLTDKLFDKLGLGGGGTLKERVGSFFKEFITSGK